MARSIVVIGGGAAGGTAAQFAKKTDRNAEVTIFEKGKYPQYSKCALPYFISGKVEDVIEFSEKWFERAGIDLYLETEVKEVDLKDRVVIAEKNGESIEKKFDSLIIATGADPSVPPIDGIYDGEKIKKGVFSLRTLDDAKEIKNFLREVENISIIGAGLIGLELSEAFYELGKSVKIIEILPSILPGMIDQDLAELVYQKIKDKVEIFVNHRVKKIDGKDEVESIVVEGKDGDEKEFDADMVILATGIRPNTKIAESIGCKMGEKRGIVVDKRSMTSVKDVYAAGDCTEYKDFVTGKAIPVGLGSIGVRQAMVAGVNAAGGNAVLPEGFLQTRTTRIFDVEISAVGPLSKEIENSVQGKYSGKTLPHYFPGGEDIVIKTVINNAGEIVSAQAVGVGSALRINTFACAIYNKMKIEEFVKLETAYAPPIAPTLDPMIISADIVRYRYGRK